MNQARPPQSSASRRTGTGRTVSGYVRCSGWTTPATPADDCSLFQARVCELDAPALALHEIRACRGAVSSRLLSPTSGSAGQYRRQSSVGAQLVATRPDALEAGRHTTGTRRKAAIDRIPGNAMAEQSLDRHLRLTEAHRRTSRRQRLEEGPLDHPPLPSRFVACRGPSGSPLRVADSSGTHPRTTSRSSEGLESCPTKCIGSGTAVPDSNPLKKATGGLRSIRAPMSGRPLRAGSRACESWL
jgi:hypothetical protein